MVFNLFAAPSRVFRGTEVARSDRFCLRPAALTNAPNLTGHRNLLATAVWCLEARTNKAGPENLDGGR